MYHPTTRVLAVLELLQTHRRLSGPELAERLEVDLRTIRRYITMLQDLGIPIAGERGRHGGYRLRPSFKLPPLMFSDDEALAVMLGLLMARRLGLAVTAPAVEGALAKLERVLPEAVRQRTGAVRDALATDLAPVDDAPSSEVVATLGVAAQEERQVWLRYVSVREEETGRAVDPYGIVYLGGRWYVAGYCHLRGDLRTFRLDRVLAVEPRAESFIRPPNFDSLAYVEHALATIPGTWRVEVLLRVNLERARRLVPARLALLEATAEGVVLRVFADDLDWTARLLVGLGCPFEVRHPPELRDALRQLAAEVATLAELRQGVSAPA
jgi:predicted DNA-binding transcriptional regulator YafY